MYHILFIHSSVHGYLGYFTFWLLWTKILWAFKYKFFFEFFCLVLLGTYPGVELLSHAILFNLLMGCWTVFHCNCTILHSHQQCTSFLISLHPHQHLLFSGFIYLFRKIKTIIKGIEWYLIVVLTCIFLMTKNDVGNLFIYLFVTQMSSLVKYLLKSLVFPPFFYWVGTNENR